MAGVTSRATAINHKPLTNNQHRNEDTSGTFH